jgi:hypothetical protein
VIVYQAVEEDDGAYEFNKLCAVCAWWELKLSHSNHRIRWEL